MKTPGIKHAFLVLIVVFFSGFASLTYQVIWERTLKYTFGGDVISASIIVSVFLLGLGIGAYLFRKIRKKALITLAWIQVLIGLFCMWSYEIIGKMNYFFESLALQSGMSPGAENLIAFLGTFLFLLVPTILMGGTLPLMLESFVPDTGKNARLIGLVYGINTLGAFSGTLIAPLFLGSLGLPGMLKISSLISMSLGAILGSMFLLGYGSRSESVSQSGGLPDGLELKKPLLLFIVAFAFLSGLIALALEILFIRFIGLLHGSTSYSFPIIISAYLLSIGIGSMFWSNIRDRMEGWKTRALPFFLQVAAGLFIPFSLIIFQRILASRPSRLFSFSDSYARFSLLMEQGQWFAALKDVFVFCLPLLILVFPVVFFSSGVFPTLVKQLNEFRMPLGKSSGIIYFANSVGCMLGSLLAGFVLIPGGGWYFSLVLMTLLSVAIGGLGIVLLGSSEKRGKTSSSALGMTLSPKMLSIIPVLMIVPIAMFLVSDRNIKYKLATGEYSSTDSIVAYEEGVTGVAAVKEVKRGNQTVLYVYSNGQDMSTLPNRPGHAYLALLPRMQNSFTNVMLLGLGGGRSLGDLLIDERVRRVMVVDWSKETFRIVGSEPATHYNLDPLKDRRVTVRMSDARKVIGTLARSDAKFDAIIDNMCFPHWPGAAGVKSVRFFQNIKEILKADGYYYHMNNFGDFEKEVLATLLDVFEYVAVHNDYIIICGRTPFIPSKTHANIILTNPSYLKKTNYLLLPESADHGNPYSAFMDYVVEIDRAALGHIPPLTDEKPLTEYYVTVPSLLRLFKKGFRID